MSHWEAGYGFRDAGVRTLAVSDGYMTEWRAAPREHSARRGLAGYLKTASWHPGTDCWLEATLRAEDGQTILDTARLQLVTPDEVKR